MSRPGPTVLSLVRDPRYFGKLSSRSYFESNHDTPSNNPAVDAVKESVWEMLGAGFEFRQDAAEGSQFGPTGLFLYDTLLGLRYYPSRLRPRSSGRQSVSHWRPCLTRLAFPKSHKLGC